jgi:sec-independent protein translocase protein TatA
MKESVIVFQGLLQPMHLIVILIIVLIIFGPGKIGDMGSSIGKAIRGFKKAMEEPEQRSEDIATKKPEDKKE